MLVRQEGCASAGKEFLNVINKSKACAWLRALAGVEIEIALIIERLITFFQPVSACL